MTPIARLTLHFRSRDLAIHAYIEGFDDLKAAREAAINTPYVVIESDQILIHCVGRPPYQLAHLGYQEDTCGRIPTDKQIEEVGSRNWAWLDNELPVSEFIPLCTPDQVFELHYWFIQEWLVDETCGRMGKRETHCLAGGNLDSQLEKYRDKEACKEEQYEQF